MKHKKITILLNKALKLETRFLKIVKHWIKIYFSANTK